MVGCPEFNRINMGEFLLLIQIIEAFLILYLGLCIAYIFLFSFAGLFYGKAGGKAVENYRKIAVLIPGYKEDQVIEHVAEDALKQDYPDQKYDVVVIADSFQPETLEKLRALPIRVIEVTFEISTKSKALNQAMDILPDDYDIAVILDADNLMANDFLTRINHSFDAGFRAVQGHRTAKNTNTPMAILDAISEEINNHIFRRGHRALGLSSALIGSAMAFEYCFFKETMNNIKAIGGFDKELELKFTKEGTAIEYLPGAIVYDEKIQSGKSFSTQRRRWLSAQFIYFGRSFPDAMKMFFTKGNIEYLNKSFQFVQLPRVMLLGITTIILVLSLIFQNTLAWPVWLGLWCLCVISLFFGVPRKFYNMKTFNALLHLPGTFFRMLLSLLRLKGANKRFIHTPHTTTTSESTSHQKSMD